LRKGSAKGGAEPPCGPEVHPTPDKARPHDNSDSGCWEEGAPWGEERQGTKELPDQSCRPGDRSLRPVRLQNNTATHAGSGRFL